MICQTLTGRKEVIAVAMENERFHVLITIISAANNAAVLPVIENVAFIRIFFSSRAAIPVLWGYDIPPKCCPLELII